MYRRRQNTHVLNPNRLPSYYSKKTNRLYSIGESTNEHFENSVKLIKPGARKDKFLEQLTAHPIVLNT